MKSQPRFEIAVGRLQKRDKQLDNNPEETLNRHSSLSKSQIIYAHDKLNRYNKLTPKTIVQDKEFLYSQNIKYQQQIADLWNQNNRLKTRLTIEDHQTLKLGQQKKTFSLAKVGQNIKNLKIKISKSSVQKDKISKKMIRNIKQEMQEIKSQNNRIKKTVKYTEINELLIENIVLQKQLQNVRKNMSLYVSKDHQKLKQANQYLRNQLEIKKTSIISQNNLINKNNQRIQKLKQDLKITENKKDQIIKSLKEQVQLLKRKSSQSRTFKRQSPMFCINPIEKIKIAKQNKMQWSGKYQRRNKTAQIKETQNNQKERGTFSQLQIYKIQLQRLDQPPIKETLKDQQKQTIQQRQQLKVEQKPKIEDCFQYSSKFSKDSQIQKYQQQFEKKLQNEFIIENNKEQVARKYNKRRVKIQFEDKQSERQEDIISYQQQQGQKFGTDNHIQDYEQCFQKNLCEELKIEVKLQPTMAEELVSINQEPVKQVVVENKQNQKQLNIKVSENVKEDNVNSRQCENKITNQKKELESFKIFTIVDFKKEKEFQKQQNQAKPFQNQLEVSSKLKVQQKQGLSEEEKTIIKQTLTYKFIAQGYTFQQFQNNINKSTKNNVNHSQLVTIFKKQPFLLNKSQASKLAAQIIKQNNQGLTIKKQEIPKFLRKYINDYTQISQQRQNIIMNKIVKSFTINQKVINQILEKKGYQFQSLEKVKTMVVNKKQFIKILNKCKFNEKEVQIALAEITFLSQDVQHLNYPEFLKMVKSSHQEQ